MLGELFLLLDYVGRLAFLIQAHVRPGGGVEQADVGIGVVGMYFTDYTFHGRGVAAVCREFDEYEVGLGREHLLVDTEGAQIGTRARHAGVDPRELYTGVAALKPLGELEAVAETALCDAAADEGHSDRFACLDFRHEVW